MLAKTLERYPGTKIIREKILKTYIRRLVVKYRNLCNLQDSLTDLENSRLSRKTGKYLCQSSGTSKNEGRLKRGKMVETGENNKGKMKEQGKKERGEDAMWEMEGTGENTRKMKEQGKKERCYVGKGRDSGELKENERTGEKRKMLCGKGEGQWRTKGK